MTRDGSRFGHSQHDGSKMYHSLGARGHQDEGEGSQESHRNPPVERGGGHGRVVRQTCTNSPERHPSPTNKHPRRQAYEWMTMVRPAQLRMERQGRLRRGKHESQATWGGGRGRDAQDAVEAMKNWPTMYNPSSLPTPRATSS